MARKHFFDERFFREIKTPEQAYWLGFIAADGSVSEIAGKRLEITLSARDHEHLCEFGRTIGYGEAKKTQWRSRLTLYSQKLFDDLARQGIHPRKSHSLLPWDGPVHLLSHYWRGVFDGDGCYSVAPRKCRSGNMRDQWQSSLVGTKEMISAFQKFVSHRENPFSDGSIYPHSTANSSWVVGYGGIRPTQAVVFALGHLQDTPVLHRKAKLAQRVCDVDARGLVEKLNSVQLLQLYQEYQSWAKVAELVGVSRNGLYKHTRKLGLQRRKWVRK
jgi:hypothetical protein